MNVTSQVIRRLDTLLITRCKMNVRTLQSDTQDPPLLSFCLLDILILKTDKGINDLSIFSFQSRRFKLAIVLFALQC